MEKDIVLNGVSLNELSKTKQAIQQEAAKFIAESIGRVNKIIEEIIDFEDFSASDTLAKEAIDLLKAVSLVSDLSGVTYYLEFSTEWGDEVTLSEKLWSSFSGLGYNTYTALQVYELNRVLADMESTSKGWHDSTC